MAAPTPSARRAAVGAMKISRIEMAAIARGYSRFVNHSTSD
jgi:hypothetical protein